MRRHANIMLFVGKHNYPARHGFEDLPHKDFALFSAV